MGEETELMKCVDNEEYTDEADGEKKMREI